MVEKVKASVDAETLALIAEGHAENDKAMTSHKAIRAAMTEHGAGQSKAGIYAFLADGAYNLGAADLKGKKEKSSFDGEYNVWYLKKNPDKAADDVPAGDRSALNAWYNAGFLSKEKPWARDVADRVLALKNVSLSSRGGFLNKMLALPKTPTDAEWQEDVPNETGGGSGGGTPKSTALAVVRAVSNAVALLDDMPADMKAIMRDVVAVSERLEAAANRIKATKKEETDAKKKAKIAKIEANLAKLRGTVTETAIKLDS